jgi:hypothetical protein
LDSAYAWTASLSRVWEGRKKVSQPSNYFITICVLDGSKSTTWQSWIWRSSLVDQFTSTSWQTDCSLSKQFAQCWRLFADLHFRGSFMRLFIEWSTGYS